MLTHVILMGCAVLPENISENGQGSSGMLRDMYHGPLNHLSAVRRGSCPMYPSCSEYARQAIERHGLFKGWAMAMDRLMRCGRDETRLAPTIWMNGTIKYYDPVDNNDFWWAQHNAF